MSLAEAKRLLWWEYETLVEGLVEEFSGDETVTHEDLDFLEGIGVTISRRG